MRCNSACTVSQHSSPLLDREEGSQRSILDIYTILLTKSEFGQPYKQTID